MDKVILKDYVKIKTGKLDANASEEDGMYPFFTCAREISRINTFAFDCECVLVAGNGELNVKYYEGKFNAYQRTYVIESIDNQIRSTKKWLTTVEDDPNGVKIVRACMFGDPRRCNRDKRVGHSPRPCNPGLIGKLVHVAVVAS